MFSRILLLVLVAAVGLAVGSLSPDIAQKVRSGVAALPVPGLARLSAQEPAASAKPAQNLRGVNAGGDAGGAGAAGVLGNAQVVGACGSAAWIGDYRSKRCLGGT